MTGNQHITVARTLIESGRHQEAQTEVLLSMADGIEDLNGRVIQLEETVIFQLSSLAERVEKCLMMPNREAHRAELLEAAEQDQRGAAA
ncbi:hypothetical protein V6U81_04430 [Micromonospora sp. CPCC 205711]|uniref:hypothetical protein n=1 Tax=Micromonospora sp. CPCC 205547 TaxID=3122400 RepID=UPI002FEEABFE